MIGREMEEKWKSNGRAMEKQWKRNGSGIKEEWRGGGMEGKWMGKRTDGGKGQLLRGDWEGNEGTIEMRERERRYR